MQFFNTKKPAADTAALDAAEEHKQSIGDQVMEALGVGDGAEEQMHPEENTEIMIDNVAEKYHVGDGIPVVVEDLHVDAENGTVSLRLNRAILERRANPAMNIHSLARGGAYGATVTSVNDRFYRLIVDSGNIQARVALTSSDELLTRGDRVTLLVYGYDEKRNYVWGACHKV